MGRGINGDSFHSLLDFLLSLNSGLDFLVGTKTYRIYRSLISLDSKLKICDSKDEVIIGYIDLFQRNGWCKTLQENKLFPLKFGQQLFQLLNEFIDEKRKFVFEPNGSFPDQLAAFSDLKRNFPASEGRDGPISSSQSNASEGRDRPISSSQTQQRRVFTGNYGGSRGDPFSGDLQKGMREIDRNPLAYQVGTPAELPDQSRRGWSKITPPQHVPTGLLPIGRRDSQLFDMVNIRDAESVHSTQRGRSSRPSGSRGGRQLNGSGNGRPAAERVPVTHSSLAASNGRDERRELTRGRSRTPNGRGASQSVVSRQDAEDFQRTHSSLAVSNLHGERQIGHSRTPEFLKGDGSSSVIFHGAERGSDVGSEYQTLNPKGLFNDGNVFQASDLLGTKVGYNKISSEGVPKQIIPLKTHDKSVDFSMSHLTLDSQF
ncbi:hypothetical protein OAP83_00390, partial [Rickettsiales bacterium]|nr:hypothetical protein [Rickettsiales bacterium]